MTRAELIAAFRQDRPDLANLSDDELLFDAARYYESQGALDKLPVLKVELARQLGARDARDRGYFGDVTAAAKRGFAGAMQGVNIAQGATDPENARDIADWEAVKQRNAASDEMTRFAKADGFAETAKAFLTNPITIISEVLAESGAGIVAGAAGGSAGAAVGSAAGPLGTVVGGAIGVGASSLATEYASTMFDSMVEAGMDPADPESIQKYFSDPKVVSSARAKGLERGIPIATFDAVTAGMAGRFIKPLKEIAEGGTKVATSTILKATGKEVAAQAAGGMGGEAAAQAVSGQPMDGKAIFLEGIAEVGTAPSEVRSNLGELRVNPKQQPAAVNPAAATQAAAPAPAPVDATVPPINPFFAAPPPVAQAPVPPPPAAPAPVKTVVERDGQMMLPAADIVAAARASGAPVIGPIDNTPDEIGTYPVTEGDTLDQYVLRRARERAALMRAVRVGDTIPFREPSVQAAYKATSKVPVIGPLDTTPDALPTNQAPGQRRLPFPKAGLDANAPMVDETGQLILLSGDKTRPVSPTPVPGASPAAPAPVEAQLDLPLSPGTPPAPTEVQTPAVTPTPVAQKADNTPVTAADIEQAFTATKPLLEIPGREQGRVGIIVSDGTNQYVLPLIYKNGKPQVVLAKAPFESRAKLIESLAAELGISIPKLKAVLTRGGGPFKDGKVDERAIVSMAEKKATQDQYRNIAQMAIDRGYFAVDEMSPLSDYLLNNGLVKERMARFTRPIPPGRNPIQYSDEGIAPAKKAKDPVREIVTQTARSMGIPNKAIDRLVNDAIPAARGMTPAERAQLVAAIKTPGVLDDVTLNGLIDRAIGQAFSDDTPEFKSKMALAALDLAPKVEVLTQSTAPAQVEVPIPADPTVVHDGTPKVSKKPSAKGGKDSVAPSKAPVVINPNNVEGVIAAFDRYRLPKATLEKIVTHFGKLGEEAKIKEKAEALAKVGKFPSDVLADAKAVSKLFAYLNERALDEQAKAAGAKGEDTYVVTSVDQADTADTEVDQGNTADNYRLSPEVIRARRDIRFSETPEGYRVENNKELIDNVTYDLLTRGYKVSIGTTAKEISAGGAVDPSRRTVALILNSLVKPDRQAVINALHEIAHDISASAPEPIRLAFHRFVERMPNGKFAYYNNPEADPRVATGEGLSPEQLTIERGVEHMALLGVDREVSRGLISSFIRAVKDAFLRAAVYMQRLMLGEERTSGRLAEAWMNNEVSKVIAGDKQVFADFLGQFRTTKTFSDIFRLAHNDQVSAFSVKLDTKSGSMVYRPVTDFDKAAINIEAAARASKESAMARGTWGMDRTLTDLEKMVGSDVLQRVSPNTYSRETASTSLKAQIANTEAMVAVANSLRPIVERLFAKYKAVEPDLDDAQRRALRREGTPPPAKVKGITEFYQLIGLGDPEFRAAEAKRTLTDMIRQEFGTEPETLPYNPDVRVEDLKPGTPAAELADELMAQQFYRLRTRTGNRLGKIKTEIESLAFEEERNRETIRAVVANLADARVTRKFLNESIAEQFKQIARDIATLSDTSEAMGEAATLLKSMQNESKRRDMTSRFTRKLFDQIAIDELPLNSMFRDLDQAVKARGLTLEKSSAAEIRDAVFDAVHDDPTISISELVTLGDGVSSADRGSALLTALIQFARSESFVADVIRVQMAKAEEKVEAINKLREAHSLVSEESLDNLATTLKEANSSRLADSVVANMLKKRDEALKKQSRLAKLRRDQSILSGAFSAFDQLVTVAESRLKIGSAFTMKDGANYIDAGSPTASPADLMSAAVNNRLVLSGPKAMTEQDMRALIDRNEAWLAPRRGEPAAQGRVFHSIMEQNAKMRQSMHGRPVADAITGVRNGAYYGIADLFARTGTNSGGRMAALFNQFVGWQRLANSQAEVMGQSFERVRAAFESASGVSPREFKDLFYDPAMRFLNQYNAGEKEAFDAMNESFRSDPTTAKYWNRPGAPAAFFTMLQQGVKKGRALKNRWAGLAGSNRVNDPKLRTENVFDGDVASQERRQIERGVEGYTDYRMLHEDIKFWAARFRERIRGDGKGNLFADLALNVRLSTRAEELSASLKEAFDDDAWRMFLEPLLLNDRGGVPGPMRSDGFVVPVAPRTAATILEAVGGRDLLAFADAVYDRLGNPADESGRQAYRQQLLGWVYQRWMKVDELASDAVTVGGRRIGIPSLGIDARSAEFLPEEWMTYPQYTSQDLKKAANSIYGSGVFGREGETIRRGIEDIQRELNAKKEELSRLNLSTRDFNTPEWQSLKRTDKAKYKRLKKLASYQTPAFADIVENLFNTEADLFTQWHAAREIFSFMTGGMVSGMKSAIKNPISTLNLVLVQRSASPEVMKTVAGSYAKMGKLFLNSFSELLGFDLLGDNPALAAAKRAGVVDSAKYTTIKDDFVGERGVDDSLGAVARNVRRMRQFFTHAKLSPLARDGTSPAFRLLNPFQYTQLLVNQANLWQIMESYYDMAAKAAEVYRANPGETRNLTVADVGMTDENAFNARKKFLLDNGYSIEDLARRAAKGQDIFDDRLVMAANNVATTYLANEASMVNRPLILSRSKLGQLSGTFVGWSLDQSTRVLKLLETEDGRMTVGSLLRGMGVLSLGILPASLAYAALLDEWDELIEKKQNRMPVSSGPEAWSEAMVSVGTLGLWAEGFDYFNSMRQGSGSYNDFISLDNRIVLVSVARNGLAALRNLKNAGPLNANYANVVRPFLSAAGMNGIMQNAYLLDRVLGNSLQDIPVFGTAVAGEASLALRSNAYNYIRQAGREIDLELRPTGGSGTTYAITPLTPHITNMSLAALQNDSKAFQEAYRKAIEVAREMGEFDPLRKVRDTFASRHPLRLLFVSGPSDAEYAKMRETMSEQGRAAVDAALLNFNRYAASLGAAPYYGATKSSEAQIRRLISRSQPEPSVLDAVRRRASQAFGEF